MRRKKRQNKITEKRNIQKEICRIPLLFLVLLSVMCTGSLTGCRVGNPQGQTELVPLNRNDTDSDKPDTAVNSGQKEQQTYISTVLSQKRSLKIILKNALFRSAGEWS